MGESSESFESFLAKNGVGGDDGGGSNRPLPPSLLEQSKAFYVRPATRERKQPGRRHPSKGGEGGGGGGEVGERRLVQGVYSNGGRHDGRFGGGNYGLIKAATLIGFDKAVVQLKHTTC